MGLDDFMDLDTESESSGSSSSSTKQNPSEVSGDLSNSDKWVKEEDGTLKSKGPYGYSDREEYEDTIEGKLELHGDLFKYHLPIFPHIEYNQEYTRGQRYNRADSYSTVTCVAHHQIELRKINREVIMLDAGHSEKEECLDILKNRFDEGVGPDTEVHLYFFAMVRHIVKMGISDEFVADWGLESQDRVIKAVYGEAFTQRFRENDTGHTDLKHIDHMKEW